ncbi:glycosyltransferase family 2 protein [Uliginosibacterium flavum]|uniref:Glycosyltransferase family 2 protein n=1 Tax=Uliginosibacterium flavum TaxID=1396831 RepID=A0ABV2TRW5_9RHOO
MKASAAIILVNWNGWRDTLECLGSLLMLEPPVPVIVVDNASSDGSADKIAAWCRGEIQTPIQQPVVGVSIPVCAPADLEWAIVGDEDAILLSLPRILIVQSSANRGFAGGNNLGITRAKQAGTEYFWLLNTDTVVQPDALDKLVNRAESDTRLGMLGSSLIYYWRPQEIQALGGASFNSRTGVARHIGAGLRLGTSLPGIDQVEAEMDYVVGASMLVTRAFIDTVGLMCEDYFLYFEEIDWAVRAKGHYRLGYAPDSHVFHKVGGSSRKTASRTSLRYLYRNRLFFIARHFPQTYLYACAYLLMQCAQHARRGHWLDVSEIAGALLRSPGIYRKGIGSMQ